MHGDDELQSMLKQLMGTCGGLGAPGKRVVAFAKPPVNDRVGEFAVRGSALGFAVLYPREERPWVSEFCTMCHELGHARSWLQGERTPEYEAAHRVEPLSSLSDRAKRLVIDEETRAWRYGFELATDVGFRDQHAYEAEADKALGEYCDQMALPRPPTFTLTA